MKVLDGEINGFKIDKFNQYGLEVGKTQGICPLCSHTRKPENRKLKCASYDWERGLGTCHNCDTSFQLHTYERRGEVTKFYEKPPRIEVVPVSTKVESWFKSRGISKKTLDDLMITEGVEWMPQTGKEENTIQFNYFIGDELVNVKYRDGRKNFKLYKGAEKVFYNIDATVGHDSVIIVEGEMDVCAIHESGFKSVVSVPNGATLNTNNLEYLDNCIDYFEDKEKIIIAVDTDEAGIALQTELVRRFGAEVSWVVDFGDCKDANEYLIKYGATSLSSILKTAKPVPLENVVTFNDIEDEVIEFVKNGFKRGYQIGLENFDNIFSTYTGQFITVTGIPSSGKSDFVDQMVVGYNKLYGWKTAFASPENAPTYLHAHKLMRKIWGNMPTINDINTGKWTEVAETVNENFFFIDMEKYNLEEVLSKGAELVKRKGIKCLVIDPYNKIRSNDSLSDVNVYTMEYLSKIEVFAKKYDVLVIIVAHPTKMYRNQEGNMEEPTMYNIKGGGEWYDASYHGILVHRNYEENTVKAKVLKVKFQNLGENGAEAHFTWNKSSGEFVPKEKPVGVNELMPWD
ncbi:MAG: toprim domain-containing protein [Desulfobulbaceae bacterium]|nr:toprim domain-containing protein [Desulfobulbaceae bacterium]